MGIDKEILYELEEGIESKLEKIKSEHNIRNGLLYRNNVDGYATLKDRQREYESQRVVLVD